MMRNGAILGGGDNTARRTDDHPTKPRSLEHRVVEKPTRSSLRGEKPTSRGDYPSRSSPTRPALRLRDVESWPGIARQRWTATVQGAHYYTTQDPEDYGDAWVLPSTNLCCDRAGRGPMGRRVWVPSDVVRGVALVFVAGPLAAHSGARDNPLSSMRMYECTMSRKPFHHFHCVPRRRPSSTPEWLTHARVSRFCL